MVSMIERMYGSIYVFVMGIYLYILHTSIFLILIYTISSIFGAPSLLDGNTCGIFHLFITLFIMRCCQDPDTPRQYILLFY